MCSFGVSFGKPPTTMITRFAGGVEHVAQHSLYLHRQQMTKRPRRIDSFVQELPYVSGPLPNIFSVDDTRPSKEVTADSMLIIL